MIQEETSNQITLFGKNKSKLKNISLGKGKQFLKQDHQNTNSSDSFSSTLDNIKPQVILFIETNENQIPEVGKLLDILQENEEQISTWIIEGQLKSFSLNENFETQHYYALQADINNPQLKRQISYNQWYYQPLVKVEDFKNSLNGHQIKEHLRAKMVDWILEVFGNYRQTTSHETFFRAVNLMDLFLKQTGKKYADSDLHLIGTTCMMIATKVEDVYHIPLSDFIARVTHNKFNATQFKEKEKEILETINYQVYFTTYLNYLSQLYFKSLNLNDKQQINNSYIFKPSILKHL